MLCETMHLLIKRLSNDTMVALSLFLHGGVKVVPASRREGDVGVAA